MEIIMLDIRLEVPQGAVDAILDTDAYNEIDDQFAIAYMLLSKDRIRTKAVCAAPFLNSKSTSPGDGMRKSHDEIMKILGIMGERELEKNVFYGSEIFMTDENTPVESAAARYMASEANNYSPDKPLYIVAIGAITNVASAILLNRRAMTENTVVVWLGGHAWHWPDTAEFNMCQDIAAARIVFSSGVSLVQLPCFGVVDKFSTTRPELEYWLIGKNPLADYLASNAIAEAESYAAGRVWSRCIWDVTAVAWLLNDNNRFMNHYTAPTPIPGYDNRYSFDPRNKPMTYVYNIRRDVLFNDMFSKISGFKG